MILALMTPFIEETVGTATLLHLAAIITLIDNIISVTCIVVVMIGIVDDTGARGGLHSPRGYKSPQQLAGLVSDLKLQLAKRDAEVDYLEAQLAEAFAANRPQPTTQMDSKNAEVS